MRFWVIRPDLVYSLPADWEKMHGTAVQWGLFYPRHERDKLGHVAQAQACCVLYELLRGGQ